MDRSGRSTGAGPGLSRCDSLISTEILPCPSCLSFCLPPCSSGSSCFGMRPWNWARASWPQMSRFRQTWTRRTASNWKATGSHLWRSSESAPRSCRAKPTAWAMNPTCHPSISRWAGAACLTKRCCRTSRSASRGAGTVGVAPEPPGPPPRDRDPQRQYAYHPGRRKHRGPGRRYSTRPDRRPQRLSGSRRRGRRLALGQFAHPGRYRRKVV